MRLIRHPNQSQTSCFRSSCIRPPSVRPQSYAVCPAAVCIGLHTEALSWTSRSEQHSPSDPCRVSGGVFVVPYTNKSLACLWLTTLGLFALTASGEVARSWLPLLLLIALTAPALILRNPAPVAVLARSRNRRRIVADGRHQSPFDPGSIDVYRWENEGGAAGRPVQVK